MNRQQDFFRAQLQRERAAPEKNIQYGVFEVILAFHVSHEFLNVRGYGSLRVWFHVNLSRCSEFRALKILLGFDIDMDGRRRGQVAENKLALVDILNAQTKGQGSLCLTSIRCLGCVVYWRFDWQYIKL